LKGGKEEFCDKNFLSNPTWVDWVVPKLRISHRRPQKGERGKGW